MVRAVAVKHPGDTVKFSMDTNCQTTHRDPVPDHVCRYELD